MSINWTIRDLAVRLKKQHVMARQLAVGDVVYTDHGVWQVATIQKEPGGLLTVLDEDGNGFNSVPPQQLSVIIHRGCFGR